MICLGPAASYKRENLLGQVASRSLGRMLFLLPHKQCWNTERTRSTDSHPEKITHQTASFFFCTEWLLTEGIPHLLCQISEVSIQSVAYLGSGVLGDGTQCLNAKVFKKQNGPFW